MSLPASAKYLVIGAGVHGLSTAWHLAKGQRARGEEPDVLIVDKTGVGAGASGSPAASCATTTTSRRCPS